MRPFPLASLLAVNFLLTGCGGGGGDPAPVTVTLSSSALLDGHVFSGGLTSIGDNIDAGDLSNTEGSQGQRGFVSFDLAAVPPGAVVLSATMSLFQLGVSGAPYVSFGPLLVDRVSYGAVLEAGAYARAGDPADSRIGTLSTDGTVGYKSLTVTSQVRADLAVARLRSQFRVRFEVETNGDANQETAVFLSAGTATVPSERPLLVVTYLP